MIVLDHDVTHNNGSEDRDWTGECAPVESLSDEAQWDLSGSEHGKEGGPGEERHRGDGGPHCYEGDGGADQEHGPGDWGERGGGRHQPVGEQREAGHSHNNTPHSWVTIICK